MCVVCVRVRACVYMYVCVHYMTRCDVYNKVCLRSQSYRTELLFKVCMTKSRMVWICTMCLCVLVELYLCLLVDDVMYCRYRVTAVWMMYIGVRVYLCGGSGGYGAQSLASLCEPGFTAVWMMYYVCMYVLVRVTAVWMIYVCIYVLVRVTAVWMIYVCITS